MYELPSVLKLTIIAMVILVSLITDLKSRKIFNIVTLPAILLGLIINAVIFFIQSHTLISILNGLLFSLQGFGIAIIVFFVLYAFGWFGGGDAKLMGAIGAFMGYAFTYWCILYTLVAGGICAFFLIIEDIAGKKRKSQIVIFFISLKDKILYNAPLIFPDKHKAATFTYSVAIVMGFIATLIKFRMLPS